jgi:hypothetical protein
VKLFDGTGGKRKKDVCRMLKRHGDSWQVSRSCSVLSGLVLGLVGQTDVMSSQLGDAQRHTQTTVQEGWLKELGLRQILASIMDQSITYPLRPIFIAPR